MRLAGQLEVLLRRLPGRLHGLAAAGGEEDPVQIAGRRGGQPMGELDRGRVRVGPDREEGQLFGLAGGGLGQHASAVPGLDDEQPGQAVEIALAAVVEDRRTLPTDDHRWRGVPVGAHAGEMQPQVLRGICPEAVRPCRVRPARSWSCADPVVRRAPRAAQIVAHSPFSGSTRQSALPRTGPIASRDAPGRRAAVFGRKRPTTSPSAASRNFSKFHCDVAGLPGGVGRRGQPLVERVRARRRSRRPSPSSGR